MATATFPVPPREHALPLRKRPDIECRAFGSGQSTYWRIKDPLTGRHYELTGQEYFALEQLDGRAGLAQIQEACERRFAPRRVSGRQLLAFFARLHRCGLLLCDSTGQAEQLLERRAEQRWQKFAWSWTNLISLRLRGIDPQPILDAIYPYCRWMFSPVAVAAALLTMLAALLLLATHTDEVRLRLPEFQAFFNLRNVGWLALTVVLAKGLHELGHALTCRHFGGQCHELGVMMLVFLPCLYCNVSDAWMFDSRWRRAAVDVAGMYVELVLAAACAFLWWFTVPGWINTICFNLMVVSSVNTLLFNGNPLLRYDGYYLLSDLLEIPNLQERSVAALRRAFAWCFLYQPPRTSDLLSGRTGGWLALYAVASWAYRCFASLAIAWFCYQALRPYRLEVLAWGLAGLMLAVLAVTPLRTALHFSRSPSSTGNIHWPRVALAAILLLVAGVALWHVPLPKRLHVPALVEPAGARRVYVSVPGRLTSAAQIGSTIEAEGQLAQLTNLEMELEIAKLRGEGNEQRTRLANLRRQQIDEPQAASELPTAEAALADLERRLTERLTEQRRLSIASPAGGTVLPARNRRLPTARGELPGWSGNALDSENRGCFLETGTLLCLVGDPRRLEALLLVDEDQVPQIRSGQSVKVLLDQLPDWELSGVVTEVSEIDAHDLPPELIDRGQLPTRRDAKGNPTPLRTCYQARVALDAAHPPLTAGATGQAKVYVDPQSLGRRLLRLVAGTFRFGL